MSEIKGNIRVVIVDDHPVVRTGLRLVLKARKGFEVVGEVGDGVAALHLVHEMQPDVVLMDLRMPGMDGLEAIRHIRTDWPNIAVIILTTYNEDDLMLRGLQAGACGYLLKDSSMDSLLQAIKAAARGEMLVQPEIMVRILTHTTSNSSSSSSPPDRIQAYQQLTGREQDVLAGVARGERNKEIANRLGITKRTVDAYLNNIYTKLDVDSRAAAVAVAIERGLLLPSHTQLPK